MPYFKVSDLDVVKPEPAHDGGGTTPTSTESTNKPSEIPEQSVCFTDDIPRSPSHETNLTMP